MHSTLLLSGIDASNVRTVVTDDGQLIEMTMDTSSSLILQPDVFNLMLGKGKPQFGVDSSKMIAWREAVQDKLEKHGTSVELYSVLPVPVKGDQPLFITEKRAFAFGKRSNMQLCMHTDISTERPVPRSRDFVQSQTAKLVNLLGKARAASAAAAGVPIETEPATQQQPFSTGQKPAAVMYPAVSNKANTFQLPPADPVAPVSMPLPALEAEDQQHATATSSEFTTLVVYQQPPWSGEATNQPDDGNALALSNAKLAKYQRNRPFYSVVMPIPKKHTVIPCFDDDDDDDSTVASLVLGEGTRKKPKLVNLSPYYPDVIKQMVAAHKNDPEFVLFSIGNEPDIKRECWNYALPTADDDDDIEKID
jgi:hypothetical protein